MEGFSTAELFLHGVTDTCSFLDAPFLQQRCLRGDITNFYQLYNYRLNVLVMRVY